MSADTFSPLHIPKLANGASDAETAKERRRGYADGYAAGQRQAYQEARVEKAEDVQRRQAAAAEVQERAAGALLALEAAGAQYHSRVGAVVRLDEDLIYSLAIDLAESILGAELSDQTRAAAHAARRAAEAADQFGQTTVNLSPADLATLGGYAPLNASADPSLASGDAVVVFDTGEVDLRVRAAIERARADLAGESL